MTITITKNTTTMKNECLGKFFAKATVLKKRTTAKTMKNTTMITDGGLGAHLVRGHGAELAGRHGVQMEDMVYS